MDKNTKNNQELLNEVAKLDINLNQIKNLIEKGADINFVDESGKIPLMHAIEHLPKDEKLFNKKLELINILISNGANVNHIDENNSSPLLYTIRYDTNISKPIIEKLLKAGANPNTEDNYHHTIVEYLILQKPREEYEKRTDYSKAAFQLKDNLELAKHIINNYNYDVNRCIEKNMLRGIEGDDIFNSSIVKLIKTAKNNRSTLYDKYYNDFINFLTEKGAFIEKSAEEVFSDKFTIIQFDNAKGNKYLLIHDDLYLYNDRDQAYNRVYDSESEHTLNWSTISTNGGKILYLPLTTTGTETIYLSVELKELEKKYDIILLKSDDTRSLERKIVLSNENNKESNNEKFNTIIIGEIKSFARCEIPPKPTPAANNKINQNIDIQKPEKPKVKKLNLSL